jgi:hypothetical protein
MKLSNSKNSLYPRMIEEENKSLVEEIKNAREKIASFTEEKEYQVGEQLAKTEDSITSLENTIESFKGFCCKVLNLLSNKVE